MSRLNDAMTLGIMKLSITTFSIMTLSRTPINIMTFSSTVCHLKLSTVSFILKSVVLPSVVMFNVIELLKCWGVNVTNSNKSYTHTESCDKLTLFHGN